MPVGGPQRCEAVGVQRYASGRRYALPTGPVNSTYFFEFIRLGMVMGPPPGGIAPTGFVSRGSTVALALIE